MIALTYATKTGDAMLSITSQETVINGRTLKVLEDLVLQMVKFQDGVSKDLK
jgi:hypothetical protein